MEVWLDSDPEEVTEALESMEKAWTATQRSIDTLKALEVLDEMQHHSLAEALNAQATLILDLNDIFPGLLHHLNSPQGLVVSKFVEDFRGNISAAFHAADLLDEWLDRFVEDADYLGRA